MTQMTEEIRFETGMPKKLSHDCGGSQCGGEMSRVNDAPVMAGKDRQGYFLYICGKCNTTVVIGGGKFIDKK